MSELTEKLRAAGERLDAAMVRAMDMRAKIAQGVAPPPGESFAAIFELWEASGEVLHVAGELGESAEAALGKPKAEA